MKLLLSLSVEDYIYNAIQRSRTPFTDELLKIAIILGASLVGMSVIELLMRMIFRNSVHRDDVIQTMNLVFVMLRYTLLLGCGYIALRACISELTNMEANNIKDVILWLHNDTVTLFDYGIKILIALILFLIFNAAQNGFFKIVKRHLEKRDVNERFSSVLINIIKYTLLTFIVVSVSLQLMITGGDNIVFIAIFVYLCIIIAVPFKRIQASVSGKNKSMAMLISLMSWTAGAIALVAAAVGIFNGLSYLLHSGGRDITVFLDEREEDLEARLDTVFMPDQNLTTTLTSSHEGSVKLTVSSDGDLNLLYLNNVQTGINTSSRKYQFFNIAINEPEITAVKNMTYVYDKYIEDTRKLEQGVSRNHYYINHKNNDCLVLTVNMHSNRIVNMTYYYNYTMISPYLIE